MRPDAEIFVQRERLGTAHAVLAARDALRRGAEDVVVAFADTPLIQAATFAACGRRSPPARPSPCSVSRRADPTGYGRLLTDGDKLLAIREEKDATPRGARGYALQRGTDGAQRRPRA